MRTPTTSQWDGGMPSDVMISAGGFTMSVTVWPALASPRPPMVLIPGTGATADDWQEVAVPLSARRTVHAMSLRGHGQSDWPGEYSVQFMADDVALALEALADEPVDLVGHSLGGLVACRVAAARPDLVHRLVLEDVGVLHDRPITPPARPPGELDFDWAMVEQIRPEIDRPGPEWAEVLAGITAPVLVISGGPSSPIHLTHVHELIDIVRNGYMVTIDAGHLIHETDPTAFVRCVEDFLDGDTPDGTGSGVVGEEGLEPPTFRV